MGKSKIKFLISTSHSYNIRHRRETASDSASKNNRRALRLNISHTTRKVVRLTNIRRLHESCGTGLRRRQLMHGYLASS